MRVNISLKLKVCTFIQSQTDEWLNCTLCLIFLGRLNKMWNSTKFAVPTGVTLHASFRSDQKNAVQCTSCSVLHPVDCTVSIWSYRHKFAGGNANSRSFSFFIRLLPRLWAVSFAKSSGGHPLRTKPLLYCRGTFLWRGLVVG